MESVENPTPVLMKANAVNKIKVFLKERMDMVELLKS